MFFSPYNWLFSPKRKKMIKIVVGYHNEKGGAIIIAEAEEDSLRADCGLTLKEALRRK